MALFQPTNVSPSTFSGTGTIDATQDLTVSWQVNGNSPMVAYQIRIMQNDIDSTEVYEGSKTTVSPAFYGVNYKGEPQFYSASISSAALASAGIVNGYENGYKLQITQWWGSSDEQSITQTSASYFITRNAPTVTMGTIPAAFDMMKYTLSATYSQAQGDALEWMEWELQKDEGSFETVYDSGKIYGTADLQFTYNAYMPLSVYRVRCTVQTENGAEADTGWVTFQTWLILPENENTPLLNACPLCDRDAVKVGVPKNAFVLGRAIGSYSFTGSLNTTQLSLPSESSVAWTGGIGTTLSIPSGVTIIVRGEIGSAASSPQYPIARFAYDEGSFDLWASTSGFYATIDGKTIFQAAIPVSSGLSYSIGISDTKYVLSYSLGGSVITIGSDLFSWQRKTIESITAYGNNRFKIIYVFSGNEPERATNYIQSNNVPGYNLDTQFLYTANSETLYSGGSMLYSNTNSFALFRKRTGETPITSIARFPIGFTSIYDYSARSQTPYTYSCYPLFSDQYSDYHIRPYFTSPEIRPIFWNYTLLTAIQDSEGIYHVISEYRFALDVASGSTGNNSTPSLWQNFTRYPARQGTSSNYKSGTLTAFIGKVENDQYVDSVDLMDELYELSTNRLTKFLKTRKGDLMMVETSAPISQQIGDKFAAQPAKISLPWVEVGNADGLGIVGNSMMADAPFFYVDLTTGELIMLYYPEYVESGAFTLNSGNLYLNDPGIYDEDDYTLSSNKYLMLEVT